LTLIDLVGNIGLGDEIYHSKDILGRMYGLAVFGGVT
jgi:hypothetical protein